MSKKINTLKDFQNCISENNIILITDSPRNNAVYHGSGTPGKYCRSVNEDNFKEKVLNNQEKNGEYYCLTSVNDPIVTQYEAKKCSNC